MPFEPPGADGLLPAGCRLGRHQILRFIASGGMASVYLGRAIGDAGFERVVAIKSCHPHLRGNTEFATMFLDEARLSARIHHPNVVAVLDVSAGDPLYLVMEYIEGDSVQALIETAVKVGREVPMNVALRLLFDTLTGLHAAHELCDLEGRPLNIVHRDVSPQNILVGVDGTTRITDFGIAKAELRATITFAGQRKGKLAYMSPEQVRGLTVTPRCDVFSAGVVLWETLCGRQLFAGASDSDTAHAVLSATIAPPSSVRAGIPPELDAAVMKALERVPARRFGSALEFATALEQCGVPMASTRAVREWVLASIPIALTERRELLRALIARPLTATEQDFASDGITVLSGPPSEMQGGNPVSIERIVPASATTIDEAEPARPAVLRPRVFVMSAVVVFAAGLIGFGLARMAKNNSTRDASASAIVHEPNAAPMTAAVQPVGVDDARGRRERTATTALAPGEPTVRRSPARRESAATHSVPSSRAPSPRSTPMYRPGVL